MKRSQKSSSVELAISTGLVKDPNSVVANMGLSICMMPFDCTPYVPVPRVAQPPCPLGWESKSCADEEMLNFPFPSKVMVPVKLQDSVTLPSESLKNVT